MKHGQIYFCCFVLLAALGCKKPYAPPIVTNAPSYLVVEGVIVAGADSTIIKLSHTVNLSKKITNSPVANATLTVESDGNASYPLVEIKAGIYASPALNLDNTRKYRLRIKTPDNQVYLSDFTAVSITPPIDSIGYTILNNGLQIYSNAHDPQNNTRYYRWNYEETWRFHSMYYSGFISNGTSIDYRPSNQQIYYCFAGDISSTILLGSTAKLAQDVVYQNPITFIPSTSEKIELRYSILLRQYALTSDAFTFWTSLKKNTEQLGSIFDAQPSQINGNIHNLTNPNEAVVGYISASTVQTKRVFIDNSEMPRTWKATYPESCQADSFYFSNPKTGQNQVLELISGSYIPLSSYGVPVIIGYMGSSRPCVDCTLRGVTQTPSFWH